jgi:type IV pilus modification protein PilV
MNANERGFTIVEILMAVLVLSVGVLALASTAGLVTRMIGQGQRYTEASTLATERFEIMRAVPCADLADGTETRGGYTLAWRVVPTGGIRGREITVNVTMPTGRGTRAYTFTSSRLCI